MLLEWDSIEGVEHEDDLDLPQFTLVSESNAKTTVVYKTGALREHREALYSRKVKRVCSSCQYCAKCSS